MWNLIYIILVPETQEQHRRFLSGTIMRKGTVDAETGGGAPPYSTFDDKVSYKTLISSAIVHVEPQT